MKINEIYQGNCLEIMKNINDDSIDLILTDPPYGMNYQSNRRTKTPKFSKIINDDVLDWFPEFIKESYRVLKNNTHIYLFCNEYNIPTIYQSIHKTKFKPKRMLVWIKNNHTSGDLRGDYGNKTEFIFYGHKGRRLLNGKRHTNILEFKRCNKLKHPTQKPIDLFSFLIEKSSDENDLVLDPFGGSGATAIACKNLNRNFILIEKDASYCNLAKERIKEHQKGLFY